MASILELLPLLAQLAPLFDPLPPVPYRRDRPSRQLLDNVLPLGTFALDHLYDDLRGTAQGEQTRRWVSSHTPPWYTHIKKNHGPRPISRAPFESAMRAHGPLPAPTPSCAHERRPASVSERVGSCEARTTDGQHGWLASPSLTGLCTLHGRGEAHSRQSLLSLASTGRTAPAFFGRFAPPLRQPTTGPCV